MNQNETELSRRAFLGATASLIAATPMLHAEDKPASIPPKLALEGGEKAVRGKAPKLVRWGDPERARLNEMAGQETLFYWKGPQTTALVDKFKKICPVEHVMTCSSGTAALHIAVAAAGIGPGDEVITSPITDMGTVIGVIYQQAVPVFADLDKSTYNLAAADVEKKITSRTKAIIAVHLGGNPCDLRALRSLADKHKLVLIEDSAQAWGARHQNEPIGTIGHITCFSLQNSKQITCGDGGVVGSSDPRFGPLLQRYGDKGFDRLGKTGLFDHFSTNYRMSEPQAAVAAAQLDRLEGIAAKRARLGDELTARISDLAGVTPHGVAKGNRCTYWFYMLRVDEAKLRCDRAQFVKALAAEGVPAAAGYIPVPLYGNPIFQKHSFFTGRWPVKEFGLTEMDYRKVKCAEAEAILKSCVRLTLHEAMSEDYIAEIAGGVAKVARHYAA